MPTDITAEELKRVLDYSASTGLFTWRDGAVPNGLCGKIAGNKRKKGYICIKVKQKLYMAHRLAWLYIYGTWPVNEIDHINRNKSDNRICNLRDISSSANKENCVAALSNNAVGLRGVKKKKHGYEAWIKANGSSSYLGTFKTPQEASGAYFQAKKKFHHYANI